MSNRQPIDDDSREESAPNKWAEQRKKDRRTGDEIDSRKNGEELNDMFD